MYVFLAFSIFSAILAIYLVAFVAKTELTPKAEIKMKVHSVICFWSSFLFLVYFAIHNNVLNFFWVIGITLYLLFNLVVTGTVADFRDYPISRKDEATWYWAIVTLWVTFNLFVLYTIAKGHLTIFTIIFVLLYLITNILVTILVFEPEKKLPIESEKNKEN